MADNAAPLLPAPSAAAAAGRRASTVFKGRERRSTFFTTDQAAAALMEEASLATPPGPLSLLDELADADDAATAASDLLAGSSPDTFLFGHSDLHAPLDWSQQQQQLLASASGAASTWLGYGDDPLTRPVFAAEDLAAALQAALARVAADADAVRSSSETASLPPPPPTDPTAAADPSPASTTAATTRPSPPSSCAEWLAELLDTAGGGDASDKPRATSGGIAATAARQQQQQQQREATLVRIRMRAARALLADLGRRLDAQQRAAAEAAERVANAEVARAAATRAVAVHRAATRTADLHAATADAARAAYATTSVKPALLCSTCVAAAAAATPGDARQAEGGVEVERSISLASARAPSTRDRGGRVSSTAVRVMVAVPTPAPEDDGSGTGTDLHPRQRRQAAPPPRHARTAPEATSRSHRATAVGVPAGGRAATSEPDWRREAATSWASSTEATACVGNNASHDDDAWHDDAAGAADGAAHVAEALRRHARALLGSRTPEEYVRRLHGQVEELARALASADELLGRERRARETAAARLREAAGVAAARRRVVDGAPTSAAGAGRLLGTASSAPPARTPPRRSRQRVAVLSARSGAEAGLQVPAAVADNPDERDPSLMLPQLAPTPPSPPPPRPSRSGPSQARSGALSRPRYRAPELDDDDNGDTVADDLGPADVLEETQAPDPLSSLRKLFARDAEPPQQEFERHDLALEAMVTFQAERRRAIEAIARAATLRSSGPGMEGGGGSIRRRSSQRLHWQSAVSTSAT
ncbi:hypothetical protein HK405_008040 [Cladochytrium tenue]|nr:hypothetical protein HK405_008040 [Cladochytrium tenue]